MRNTASRLSGKARILLGLAASALLIPSAWAYVNGGDHHTTRWDYEKELRRANWAVGGGKELAGDYKITNEITKGIKVDPPDNLEFRYYVSQMVGRALKALPEEEADDIPIEVKREIARRAGVKFRDWMMGKEATNISEELIGSVKYRMGMYSYESWWETNYKGGPEGGRRIHARTLGWVPFVALKVVEPEAISKR